VSLRERLTDFAARAAYRGGDAGSAGIATFDVPTTPHREEGMRKLRMDLADVRVESFTAGAALPRRGTVPGHLGATGNDPRPTCGASCAATCETCVGNTCESACRGTCASGGDVCCA
jgi:hypothetical protein